MVLSKPEPKGYTYYKTPRYPDFPYNEWRVRIRKAQELMAENGVDCLTVWERENVRYFFGFQTIHWFLKTLQSAIGIIPVSGEPVLIVPYLFLGNAEGLCWVRDIRAQSDAHQPRAQRELPKEVADVIKELGYGNKNIALESGPLGCMYIPRPLNDIETLKKGLPDATFVDGDRIIWGCRMIKSPLEIERIKKSIDGIISVELAIVEEYMPGMTEVDLLKVINHARADLEGNFLGDDAIAWEHFVCGKEKSMFADIMALEGVPIMKDAAIQFDGAMYYKGYCPDNARMYQVGPITEEIKQCYEIIWEGEDNVEDMLKPGVKANEVYEAIYEPVKSAEFTIIDMGGHGTGMDTHEPPSIDAWNEMTIEEGMTLSIEPWMISEKGVLFGIQDTYQVTDKGCTIIPGLRRDIIQVSHPIL